MFHRLERSVAVLALVIVLEHLVVARVSSVASRTSYVIHVGVMWVIVVGVGGQGESTAVVFILYLAQEPQRKLSNVLGRTSAASLLGSDKDFTHMMRWTRYENNKITDIRKQLYYICTCFSQTTLSHKVCTSTYDTVASLYFILQLDAHPTFGPWALSITVIRRHVKNLIIESPSSTFSKLQALQTQPVMTLLLVVLGEAPLANGTHGVLTGRHDVSDNRVRVRYLYARQRWNDDGKTPFVYL